MNYLSDTTRKERRSLLAAGFVGIVVAQLKIYPTEVDIWGLKFHSPDLPLIAVGSLCAVIGYFLVKFVFSYQFEKSSSTSALLAEQITEGRIALDIARAEEELDRARQSLLIQQDNHQKQQENASARIKSLQEQLTLEDISHTGKLKALDKEISGVREMLGRTPDALIQLSNDVSMTRNNLEGNLLTLEEARKAHLLDMENRRLKQTQNLENEINNVKALSERLVGELKQNENDFMEKRATILEFQKMHTTQRQITPFHLFLEIWFPVLFGVIAIVGLICLMFNMPPPPKPLSLPEV